MLAHRLPLRCREAVINFNRDNRKSDAPRINAEITSAEVRLIDEDGNQAGLVKITAALDAARAAGLDLVEIAPKARPPVCKIIDYGKYRYELSKKEKDARKKQHIVQVKRVQLSPNIDTHDFNVKLAAARKFLDAGHRVKVLMMMRGRLVTRRELAEKVLTKFTEELLDTAKMDGGAKNEGMNGISVVLVKKK